MKTLFIDTNLFLQCKPLEDLPWDKVYDGEETILLFIPHTVVVEIDHLKSDGNSRRAKRARKANSFFRKILDSNTDRKIVRKSEPYVEISFSLPLRSKIAKPEVLDLDSMDDKIIYEAYIYEKGSSSDVAILTYDTSLMLKAKQCGLDYLAIPKDWLLPSEPDEKDKRIAKLESRINSLENSYPQIEVEAKDISGHALEALFIRVTTYAPLSDKKIKALVEEAGKRSPLATEFNEPPSFLSPLHSMGLFKPPSAEEIKEYREKTYPEWLNKVNTFYDSLDRKLELPTRNTTISLVLRNSGVVPAKNVRVEIRALGGLLFSPPYLCITKNILESFPRPPSPPEGRWVASAFDVRFSAPTALPSLLTKMERDMNVFYWKDGRPHDYKEQWLFECDEFPHQLEPKIFNVNLFVPRQNNIPGGAIEFVMSASNLPVPFKQILSVKNVYTKSDTDTEADRLLNKVLPKINVTKNKI